MLTWKDQLNKAVLDDDAAGVARLLQQPSIGRFLWSIVRCIRTDNPRHNSLLHLAAYSNSADAARLLIDSGESMNYRNGVGDTPLHVAAYYNAWETADLLISRGAEIYARNQAGSSPLDIAVDCGNDKLAELLRLTARRSVCNE